LYDGLNPIQERSGGSVTASLLGGLGIDEFFKRTEGSSAEHYLTDALGSTLRLTDNSAAKVVDYTYEAYGETSADAASGTALQYTGRENEGTGLYYYRARYYDPVLKRFISEDPIGTTGGINYYSYAYDSPVNFNDPTGELPPLAAAAVAGAITGAIAGAAGAIAGGNTSVGQIALAAGLGAVSGATIGAAVTAGIASMGGAMIANALAGMGANVLVQMQNVGNPCYQFDWNTFMMSGLGGGVGRGLSIVFGGITGASTVAGRVAAGVPSISVQTSLQLMAGQASASVRANNPCACRL
jgi:RHS repeat-associated protein